MMSPQMLQKCFHQRENSLHLKVSHYLQHENSFHQLLCSFLQHVNGLHQLLLKFLLHEPVLHQQLYPYLQNEMLVHLIQYRILQREMLVHQIASLSLLREKSEWCEREVQKNVWERVIIENNCSASPSSLVPSTGLSTRWHACCAFRTLPARDQVVIIFCWFCWCLLGPNIF